MAPEVGKIIRKLDQTFEEMMGAERLEVVINNLETIRDLDIE